MRLRSLFVVPIVLATAACLEDTPTQLDPQLARSDAATGQAGAATYRVTLYNLTGGQPLTPPLAVAHRQSIALFAGGSPASIGIQEIAENGNLAPMLEALEMEKHAKDVVVTFGPTLPPVLPGEMVTFDLSTERGAKYFSFVSMLICTNDGFAGVNSARLPGSVGDAVTLDAMGYDAGTEINTEDFADLVPPCGPLTGVEPDAPGTGMSNPDLAENGVVHVHPGIAGIADLVPEIHDWDNPVARIEIERIG